MKGLVTRNTHVQYESPITSSKKVMAKFLFTHTCRRGRWRGYQGYDISSPDFRPGSLKITRKMHYLKTICRIIYFYKHKFNASNYSLFQSSVYWIFLIRNKLNFTNNCNLQKKNNTKMLTLSSQKERSSNGAYIQTEYQNKSTTGKTRQSPRCRKWKHEMQSQAIDQQLCHIGWWN